jgi:hypothetical protein
MKRYVVYEHSRGGLRKAAGYRRRGSKFYPYRIPTRMKEDDFEHRLRKDMQEESAAIGTEFVICNLDENDWVADMALVIKGGELHKLGKGNE